MWDLSEDYDFRTEAGAHQAPTLRRVVIHLGIDVVVKLREVRDVTVQVASY